MKSAIHACKFLVTLEAPHTQVTRQELHCLLNYATLAQVIVEIGCYEGRTTAALATHTRGQVFSIDPFLGGRVHICYGEIIAKMHCRRQSAKNVRFIKGFSHDVAPGFTEAIDLLFIDADHNYEAITKDWQDWFPKVRPGGIIALHDSRIAENSPSYVGSMKFYDQDIPKISGIEQIDAVDSLTVFRVQATR